MKLTKTFALILAALMALAGCSLATAPEAGIEAEIETEIEEPIVSLMGTVNQLTEEGLLLDTDMGPVLVLTNEETYLEGFEALTDLTAGRMVEVMFNGMMTRSIPAQINAMKIGSVQLSGTVTEVMETAFMMDTLTHGPVVVNLAEGAILPQADQQVTVTFNGAMTMSLPAQIGAWVVE